VRHGKRLLFQRGDDPVQRTLREAFVEYRVFANAVSDWLKQPAGKEIKAPELPARGV
jgi:hypothetical protein